MNTGHWMAMTARDAVMDHWDWIHESPARKSKRRAEKKAARILDEHGRGRWIVLSVFAKKHGVSYAAIERVVDKRRRAGQALARISRVSRADRLEVYVR